MFPRQMPGCRTDPGEEASSTSWRQWSWKRSTRSLPCRPRLGDDRRAKYSRLSGTGTTVIDVAWVPGRSRKDMAPIHRHGRPTARSSRPWPRRASVRDERLERLVLSNAAEYLKALGLGAAFWPERPVRVKAPPQSGPDLAGVPWWDRMEPTTWSEPAWRRRRSVRRFQPKPSTSVPAAPGQG